MNTSRLLSLFSLATCALIAPLSAFAEAKPDPAFAQKIEAYLATEKGKEQIGKALESYMNERQARAKKEAEQKQVAELENQFKNPVKIDIGKSPVKGPASAKVTIIEFSDFQCPYCTRGRETMEKVLKEYPNDVKVVFKNLPLPFHNQAMPAAKAALAAHRQNKFWEMHDELFANQQKLNEGFYVEAATKLGLNIDQFKKDMADPEIEKQVKEDAALAEKNDIQGTPGFFVNGVAVKGAYPYEHFKTIIDRWLAKK